MITPYASDERIPFKLLGKNVSKLTEFSWDNFGTSKFGIPSIFISMSIINLVVWYCVIPDISDMDDF